MQLNQNKLFLQHMEGNRYYDNSKLYEYKAKKNSIILKKKKKEKNVQLKKLNHKKLLMNDLMEMIVY
jgi:hypothetical protein